LLDEWNPLTEDGDAFRLAVKLGMDVEIGITFSWACAEKGNRGGHSVPTHGDPLTATRLAIVRAAAEIGRTMP